ncbi:MAG TPA: serine/threonine protein kinase [Oscillatoriaceae cyanobacterium M33_DOE_052]|uniref:Protein kinase domain-containing protein n=1 Tax=Planktothricoides sp. SpSt-374 TaxID=2282167 RepID=A0A7C3VQG7_9CYAN|nr:serine/threonine protein kinase [Oscillatoriaceae cyanobacterium M33_DOE_052]
MSYCLNPKCPNPADPWHAHNRICCHCGSSLVLQQRYHIKRLLGEGGFGKTFEVEDHHHLQTKVLKVLIDDNPKAVALFEREAQVLSRLQHPGIPKVEPDGYFTFYPRNSHKPLHCLVMELIEGCNLEEWMAQRQHQPITESRAVDWLKQLVEILHQVHHQNYFHRDIKPSNIMLRPSKTGEDWQLALIDFGTAREVSGTYLAKVGAGHRMTGIVSPGYTPPEQINGKAVPQSDFFALGRTFVYLLAGRHPNDFQEDPRTGELRWRESARVSENFANLIDRLMSPFPGNRPHNTDAISQYLETIDQGTGGSSPRHPVTPSPPPPTSPSPRHPVTPSPHTHHRSSRSRRWRAKKAVTKKVLMGTAILLLPLSAAQFSREIDAFLRQAMSSMRRETATNMVKMSRSPDAISAIYSLQQIALTNTISAHLWGVNAIAISPDNRLLVSGSADKTLKIWDLATGDQRQVLDHNGEQVSAVAVSPKGFTFASGGSDRTVKLWGLESGKLLWTFEGHSGWVLAIAYSPDGNILASASADGTVKLWELASATLTHTLSGHTSQVVSLAFSPREPLLASGSDDGTIKLWNTTTGKLLQTWQSNSWRVRSVAISPDGKILASGSESGTIQLYSLHTGELLRTLHRQSGAVQSLAFMPLGATSGAETLILAIGGGSLDSTIELWDASKGEHLSTLTGHRDTVHSLSISADGTILTSGSEDNTIKIWRLPSTGQISIEK